MSLDIYLEKQMLTTVYDANITHNLNTMAAEGGIYDLLWHPAESGIKLAGQLIEPLEFAIAAMKEDPARFKKHNSPNGWGMYEHFLPWLEKLPEACRENPDATVRASI